IASSRRFGPSSASRAVLSSVEPSRSAASLWRVRASGPAKSSCSHPHRRRAADCRRRRARAPTMDEKEFRRMLELFPVVRSRDYCAEPGTSSKGMKQPLRIQEATKSNKKDSSGVEDLFMQKLKMAAEEKIGATKAEFFCKAFEAHEKLVYKELNLDAAKKFLSAYES
ncbi:unnamed protein product, partial [Urochloa humidicola]